MEPWFVTGFVEGTAGFTFSRSGKQITLYFAMKLPVQDSDLLERVREYFDGIGTIYEVGDRTSYLRVNRAEDLKKIVDHLDSYPLLGAKAQVYAVWKRMVELKRDFRHADREELERLARQLSTIVRRTPP